MNERNHKKYHQRYRINLINSNIQSNDDDSNHKAHENIHFMINNDLYHALACNNPKINSINNTTLDNHAPAQHNIQQQTEQPLLTKTTLRKLRRSYGRDNYHHHYQHLNCTCNWEENPPGWSYELICSDNRKSDMYIQCREGELQRYLRNAVKDFHIEVEANKIREHIEKHL